MTAGRSVVLPLAAAASLAPVQAAEDANATAQDDAGIRKELDARYEQLAEAHEREDLKAIVAMKTPDFHAIFPDGRVGAAKP